MARVAILFVALLVIGLATRYPAWQFPHLYALHGVLAAPFFSALALWHFNRNGHIGALLAASGALALFLGAMNPVMGLSFVLLALCVLVAYALLTNIGGGTITTSGKNLVCAIAFGALDYPCALATGVALGSYAFSFESLPMIVLLCALSIALSVFAVLIVSTVRKEAPTNHAR